MFRTASRICVDKYLDKYIHVKLGRRCMVKYPIPVLRLTKKDSFPEKGLHSSSHRVSATPIISRFPKLFKLLTMFSHNVPKDVTATVDISCPEDVRGMTKLDRDKFKRTVYIPGVRVPASNITRTIGRFRNHLLKMNKVKSFADLPDGDPGVNEYKIMLLDPQQHQTKTSFKQEEIDLLEKQGVDIETWQLYQLDLDYENWTPKDVFKAVLPVEVEGVSAFTTVGHIAQLNLKEVLLDYRFIIGQVLVDKFKTIQTVVNKTSAIDNTFRNFQMELIAGEDNYITTVKENGFQYKMDFSKVYWNSRLGAEHERIVSLLKPDDVLYDVFAGIGPFAIPAGRKKCTVVANDLNPESYRWLQENVNLNRVESRVRTYNMDGREFIRNVAKADLISKYKDQINVLQSVHFVMNLPALAIEFLDSFKGLLSGQADLLQERENFPMVYCHCFSKAADPTEEIKERVAIHLDSKLAQTAQVRFVRNVAPNKDMYCVIFQLDKETLLWEGEEKVNIEEDEPDRKKVKCQDTPLHENHT